VGLSQTGFTIAVLSPSIPEWPFLTTARAQNDHQPRAGCLECTPARTKIQGRPGTKNWRLVHFSTKNVPGLGWKQKRKTRECKKFLEMEISAAILKIIKKS
jgi:hypothetical protein